MNNTLVFILLIVLILGIIILGVMIISSNKKHIDKLLDENAKNANEINMRLISLVTEVILHAEPITQREIDYLSEDIKEHNRDLHEKGFDPFEIAGEHINVNPNDLPAEENIDEDILIKTSSIVK